MAIEATEIEQLIRAAFPDAKINITDLAGDGNHYAAEVIDESFRGKNRVQQQRERCLFASRRDRRTANIRAKKFA